MEWVATERGRHCKRKSRRQQEQAAKVILTYWLKIDLFVLSVVRFLARGESFYEAKKLDQFPR